MTIHGNGHEHAGKTVKITAGAFAGKDYHIEDWWDRVAGKSWMDCDGNPACLEYAIRSSTERTPISNDVVYGKIGGAGKLIHISLGQPEAVETI